MKEICEWFACVYARRDGCAIQGYTDPEGEFNGTQEHCHIYDVMCISAKCSRCSREGTDVCPKSKEASGEHNAGNR